MKIIGLTGLARSGKDTVGDMIARRAMPGEVIKVTAFADQLKLSACRCFFPDADLEEALAWADDLKESGNVTLEDPQGFVNLRGREFLQNFGVEAHRDLFGADFWLDAVLPEGRDDCSLLVVTDVRFDNEAHRIILRGGEVWEIFRPELSLDIDPHTSESGVSDALVTGVIRNDGSLHLLRIKVRDAL